MKVTEREYAQIPPEILDLVINPMMNVKQGYEVGKTKYENEIGNRLLVTSSSFYRHNHLFKLMKQYIEEISEGNRKYFVSVLDFNVGLHVGLFDDDHIEKERKRLSPIDFDMEYGCLFPDLSENSWISPQDLLECSTLDRIETNGADGYRYVMGLDVARVRGNDNTSIQVIKLIPRKGYFIKALVYSLTLNGEKFETQNKVIRDILKKFPNIERIFMDASGLGVGLVDEMSKPYWDIEEQKEYPPLIDMNDEQAMKDISNGIPLIYGIKPAPEINHKLGMAVKKATQRKQLKLYSINAGDDKETLTEEEERLILEAEATRREVMRIEAVPSGVYLKFQSAISKGEESRKDRWSALALALYGAELLEADLAKPEQSILVGKASLREV